MSRDESSAQVILYNSGTWVHSTILPLKLPKWGGGRNVSVPLRLHSLYPPTPLPFSYNMLHCSPLPSLSTLQIGHMESMSHYSQQTEGRLIYIQRMFRKNVWMNTCSRTKLVIEISRTCLMHDLWMFNRRCKTFSRYLVVIYGPGKKTRCFKWECSLEALRVRLIMGHRFSRRFLDISWTSTRCLAAASATNPFRVRPRKDEEAFVFHDHVMTMFSWNVIVSLKASLN